MKNCALILFENMYFPATCMHISHCALGHKIITFLLLKLFLQLSVMSLKGIVYAKIRLSSFRFVIPNLHFFFFLMQNTKKYILKKVSAILVHTLKVTGIQNNTGPHWLSLYRQNKKLKSLSLWSAEEIKPYLFRTTWKWVSDDRIFILVELSL